MQAIPEQPGEPKGDPLPPESLGTPNEVRADPDERIRWWQPTWRDAFRQVGYRWLLLIPLLLVLALGGFGLSLMGLQGALFAAGFKVFALLIAGAISLAGYVIRKAVQARAEPFCIFCGYNLTGLPDNYRCPECGRPYTWQMIAEYRRDPHWFIERYKACKHLPAAGAPFEAGAVRRRRRSRDGTE